MRPRGLFKDETPEINKQSETDDMRKIAHPSASQAISKRVCVSHLLSEQQNELKPPCRNWKLCGRVKWL